MEEKLYHLLETTRGKMKAEDYVQVIAVTSLVALVSQTKRVEGVSVQNIIRSEEQAKASLISALKKIQREIPLFKEGFDMFTALESLEATQVTKLFYIWNDVEISEKVNNLISKMYIESNKNEVTSSSISKLSARILQPVGTIYDGTIGLAGSAIEIYKQAKKADNEVSIYGQEINLVTAMIARIRLYIAGVQDSDIQTDDVLLNPKHLNGGKLKKFDYVFMDAPISMRLQGYEEIIADKYNRFFYGTPARTNGDFAFVSHALASLNEDGKAIVTLGDGALFRTGADGRIRSNLIEADIIEAVISLPSGFLSYSNISINIVLFNKNKDESMKGKVQFIKVSEVSGGRHIKSLTNEQINEIVDLLTTRENVQGFSAVLDYGQLENDILLPARYVLPGIIDVEGLGEISVHKEEYDRLEKVAMGQCTEIFRGFNVSSNNKMTEDGRFKIIRLSDVQNGKLLIDQVPLYEIETKARVEMYKVQKDDVIVSIRGGVVKAAVIEEDIENLLISQNFAGIRANHTLNPYYIKTFIESPIGQYVLTSRLSGATIQTLSINDVKSLEVPILSEQKQDDILNTFIKRDKEIDKEMKRLKQEKHKGKLELYKSLGLGSTFTV